MMFIAIANLQLRLGEHAYLNDGIHPFQIAFRDLVWPSGTCKVYVSVGSGYGPLLTIRCDRGHLALHQVMPMLEIRLSDSGVVIAGT